MIMNKRKIVCLSPDSFELFMSFYHMLHFEYFPRAMEPGERLTHGFTRKE
jgi:hypothetical protein